MKKPICSLLTSASVTLLAGAASADNLKLNREFNENGNITIADQFNNRVIEINPAGRDSGRSGSGQ